VLEQLDAQLAEMKSCKSRGLCCGAGGAQMWKEAEHGNKEINIERTEQALEVKPDIIASACPFCNTMMTDGVKMKEQEEGVKVFDVAELVAMANGLFA
jgi:Fe-S oxidoreductase